MKFVVFLIGSCAAVAALLAARSVLVRPSSGDADALVVWFHQYGEAGTDEACQRYTRAFEQAYPGLRAKLSMFPGDYDSKVNAALLAGQGPDVFEHEPTLDDVRNKRIAPLDGLFPEHVRADFDPLAMEALTFEGKVYGVKIVTDTALLYYRRSMLRAAGVEPPRTLRELVDAARTLTTREHKGLFIGNDGGANAGFAWLIIQSAGEKLVDRNGCSFSVLRVVPGVAMLRELNQQGGLLVGATADWWDPSAFINGECAMQWCGLWAMPAIRKALGDDFGIVAWPALDERGVPVTFVGGHSLCVNAASPRRQQALDYLRWTWIDNFEIQADWNLAYGFHLPPRQTVAAQAAALQSGVPAEALRIVRQHGKSMRDWLWLPEMDATLTSAMAAIVKRGAEPQNELNAAVERINRAMNRLLGK
jgi:multiple sugar transport system substrate-binding protein